MSSEKQYPTGFDRIFDCAAGQHILRLTRTQPAPPRPPAPRAPGGREARRADRQAGPRR